MYREFPAARIISFLAQDNLLPAILFRTSRRQCDDDVERLTHSRAGMLAGDTQRTLKVEVESVIKKYGMDASVIREHAHYRALVTTGAGAHHAGQLLMWRLLLEELMTRGILRLMIATGTVAAGVDFPARTVVITAHSKRGGEGFRVLTASEFQQMSGRAGRRGKDTVGICVVAPSPFCDARVIHEVASRPAEPLRSAYFASPSTVLNLLKFRNVEDLRYTVSKSLAAFLDRKSAHGIRRETEEKHREAENQADLPAERRKKQLKAVRRRVREAEALEGRQESLLNKSLEGLTALGHLDEKGLTEKGGWAAELCTTLVLELAEGVNSNFFQELSTIELIGIAASISGDPHRMYFRLAKNPLKKELYERMKQIVAFVRERYQNPATSEISVLPDAALTVITWMEAGSWSEFSALLRLNGVAEGDVARLVTQSADHLNQLARLMTSHRDLAITAEEGRRMIMKPPFTDAITLIGD